MCGVWMKDYDAKKWFHEGQQPNRGKCPVEYLRTHLMSFYQSSCAISLVGNFRKNKRNTFVVQHTLFISGGNCDMPEGCDDGSYWDPEECRCVPENGKGQFQAWT